MSAAHAPAELLIVAQPRQLLLRREGAAAVFGHPVDRVEDEGREHVEIVVIGDAEAAMHGVDAVECLAGAVAAKTVLTDFGEQQFGVVVALARPAW